MESQIKKVVLVSKVEYSTEYEPFLKTIIDEGIELVCVVGTDCARWEDAIDFLHVRLTLNDPSPPTIITTSHPNESIEDVVEFAKIYDTFESDYSPEVRIIEVP